MSEQGHERGRQTNRQNREEGQETERQEKGEQRESELCLADTLKGRTWRRAADR